MRPRQIRIDLEEKPVAVFFSNAVPVISTGCRFRFFFIFRPDKETTAIILPPVPTLPSPAAEEGPLFVEKGRIDTNHGKYYTHII
jgi:hypothetical protein